MKSRAISIENLSKVYLLGQRDSYQTIRDVFFSYSKARQLQKCVHWALKDINLNVDSGEIVGIIGRNGAGKSTLLKILSRITYPSSGRIEIRGTIGSLLEVGTGFHPELSGYENIFLNGSILGMRRQEIEGKIDEIIKFAEIDKFLDTPVKRYSSGMYVRLAFSVAAHLDPEILLVDEVLAVGDAAFQKKCLEKMNTVAKEGRTVLFVSHNLNAIRILCTKTVVLVDGAISFCGATREAINHYTNLVSDKFSKVKYFNDIPDKSIILLKMQIFTQGDKIFENFDINNTIIIEIEYRVKTNIIGTNLALSIVRDGMNVIWTYDIDQDKQGFYTREKGDYCSRITIPPGILGIGLYSIYFDAAVYNKEHISKYSDCLFFKIENYSMDLMSSVNLGGVINIPLKWYTKKLHE